MGQKSRQLFSGAYFGSCIGWGDLLQLRHLLLPLLLIVIGYVAKCFVIAWLLHRRYHFRRNTAMRIMTPAGASDIARIASDWGGFSSELVILHLVRFIAVTTLFPQINHLLPVCFDGFCMSLHSRSLAGSFL